MDVFEHANMEDILCASVQLCTYFIIQVLACIFLTKSSCYLILITEQRKEVDMEKLKVSKVLNRNPESISFSPLSLCDLFDRAPKECYSPFWDTTAQRWSLGSLEVLRTRS